MTLILSPTYNERDNVGAMLEQLLALDLDADVLFIDDNSPDGTGELLDRFAAQHPRIHVIHRTAKLGIGSAHLEGIRWAYDRGYTYLVTMDCDFAHSPSDIERLRQHMGSHAVVLGSRYLQPGSLPNWNILRRFLTNFGHVLTTRLLRIPFDATGAFRVYDLSKIPPHLFSRVVSSGYSFFFESLLLLVRNGVPVAEVPIVLPARTYGHSKMSLREACRSARRIVELWAASALDPGRFHLTEPVAAATPGLQDPQHWDDYWAQGASSGQRLYSMAAGLYRAVFIRRRLSRVLRRHFRPGSSLLHAGCGSGQVDLDISGDMAISAVDISRVALSLYAKNNPAARALKHGTIFDLPFDDATFDGAYNLGVLEHFAEPEIERILSEMNRVVKPGGKIVVFWPHRFASSVLVLRGVHWALAAALRKRVRLHPPEISLLRSRRVADRLFRQAGFSIVDYSFGPGDLFVQVAIVGQKR
jgi:dolichol-phosphate mannosyltransferase